VLGKREEDQASGIRGEGIGVEIGMDVQRGETRQLDDLRPGFLVRKGDELSSERPTFAHFTFLWLHLRKRMCGADSRPNSYFQAGIGGNNGLSLHILWIIRTYRIPAWIPIPAPRHQGG
jgi:hypothetical protein